MQRHATYNISFKYLQILPYPSSVVGSLELGFARSPSSMMNPATTSSSETWPLPSWSCTTQFGNFQRLSKRSWHSIVSNCTTIHTTVVLLHVVLRRYVICYIAILQSISNRQYQIMVLQPCPGAFQLSQLRHPIYNSRTGAEWHVAIRIIRIVPFGKRSKASSFRNKNLL